jgi:hypothetical protein
MMLVLLTLTPALSRREREREIAPARSSSLSRGERVGVRVVL